MRCELIPKNRKSFYGKCYVEENGDIATLYSYDRKIMTYNKATKEVETTFYYDYSQTTKRHQTAFCEYYGIEKEMII